MVFGNKESNAALQPVQSLAREVKSSMVAERGSSIDSGYASLAGKRSQGVLQAGHVGGTFSRTIGKAARYSSDRALYIASIFYPDAEERNVSEPEICEPDGALALPCVKKQRPQTPMEHNSLTPKTQNGRSKLSISGRNLSRRGRRPIKDAPPAIYTTPISATKELPHTLNSIEFPSPFLDDKKHCELPVPEFVKTCLPPGPTVVFQNNIGHAAAVGYISPRHTQSKCSEPHQNDDDPFIEATSKNAAGGSKSMTKSATGSNCVEKNEQNEDMGYNADVENLVSDELSPASRASPSPVVPSPALHGDTDNETTSIRKHRVQFESNVRPGRQISCAKVPSFDDSEAVSDPTFGALLHQTSSLKNGLDDLPSSRSDRIPDWSPENERLCFESDEADKESSGSSPKVFGRMGSRTAFERARANRNERYLALSDYSQDTQSDKESDTELQLQQKPARAGKNSATMRLAPYFTDKSVVLARQMTTSSILGDLGYAVEAIERSPGYLLDKLESSEQLISTHSTPSVSSRVATSASPGPLSTFDVHRSLTSSPMGKIASIRTHNIELSNTKNESDIYLASEPGRKYREPSTFRLPGPAADGPSIELAKLVFGMRNYKADSSPATPDNPLAPIAAPNSITPVQLTPASCISDVRETKPNLQTAFTESQDYETGETDTFQTGSVKDSASSPTKVSETASMLRSKNSFVVTHLPKFSHATSEHCKDATEQEQLSLDKGRKISGERTENKIRVSSRSKHDFVVKHFYSDDGCSTAYDGFCLPSPTLSPTSSDPAVLHPIVSGCRQPTELGSPCSKERVCAACNARIGDRNVSGPSVKITSPASDEKIVRNDRYNGSWTAGTRSAKANVGDLIKDSTKTKDRRQLSPSATEKDKVLAKKRARKNELAHRKEFYYSEENSDRESVDYLVDRTRPRMY